MKELSWEYPVCYSTMGDRGTPSHTSKLSKCFQISNASKDAGEQQRERYGTLATGNKVTMEKINGHLIGSYVFRAFNKR